jgi:hypothetical protein
MSASSIATGLCFKKEPTKVIPNEIITSHKQVMEIIIKKLNSNEGAAAEYDEHVKNFCKFVSDVTNIGLCNENSQMGRPHDIINDPPIYYEDIFEYVISPIDPYGKYVANAANNIIEFLINCGFTMNETHIAGYGCGLNVNDFVWVENTILFKM